MKYLLNIEKQFTDKLTNEKHKIGDVIECSKERGEELLNDVRKLVSINKIIEDIKDKKENKKSDNKSDDIKPLDESNNNDSDDKNVNSKETDDEPNNNIDDTKVLDDPNQKDIVIDNKKNKKSK